MEIKKRDQFCIINRSENICIKKGFTLSCNKTGTVNKPVLSHQLLMLFNLSKAEQEPSRIVSSEGVKNSQISWERRVNFIGA